MSSTRKLAVAAFFALLVLVWPAAAHAQQPIEIPGVGYDPCLDPNKVTVVAIDESAASGTTQHLAASGSMYIYVCGGSLQGGAAGTITLEFGNSGGSCASPTTFAIISVVTNGDGKPLYAPGTYARSATGKALCSVRSASMSLIGELRVVQENAP